MPSTAASDPATEDVEAVGSRARQKKLDRLVATTGMSAIAANSYLDDLEAGLAKLPPSLGKQDIVPAKISSSDMDALVLSSTFASFVHAAQLIVKSSREPGMLANPSAFLHGVALPNLAIMAQCSGRLVAENSGIPGRAIHERLLFVLRPLMPAGTLAGRVLRKPLGYAGDYLTIEQIYSADSVTMEKSGLLGWATTVAIMAMGSAKAVRARRDYLASKIAALPAGATVMSIASGPAAEAFDYLAASPDTDKHIFLLDSEKHAIQHVKSRRADLEQQLQKPLGRTLAPLLANVVHAMRKPSILYGEIGCNKLDLVYSSGLIDYFTDEFVIKMLNWIHDEVLAPGGSAILGNFAHNEDESSMAAIIYDWALIYRTKEKLASLVAKSHFGPQAGVTVEHGGHPTQLFVIATKCLDPKAKL